MTRAFAENDGPPRRASWSPRWARTATTAARRSSPRPSPTSASTSRSGRCSPRPRRSRRCGQGANVAHRRRLVARRRPSRAGAGAEARAGGGRPRRGDDRRRRRHPGAGFRAAARGRRRRDLPARHGDRRGGAEPDRAAQRSAWATRSGRRAERPLRRAGDRRPPLPRRRSSPASPQNALRAHNPALRFARVATRQELIASAARSSRRRPPRRHHHRGRRPRRAALAPRLRRLQFPPGAAGAPRLRDSIRFALYEGSRDFGATGHVVSAQVDEGAIVGVRRCRVRENPAYADYQSEMVRALLALIADLAPALALGAGSATGRRRLGAAGASSRRRRRLVRHPARHRSGRTSPPHRRLRLRRESRCARRSQYTAPGSSMLRTSFSSGVDKSLASS